MPTMKNDKAPTPSPTSNCSWVGLWVLEAYDAVGQPAAPHNDEERPTNNTTSPPPPNTDDDNGLGGHHTCEPLLAG